MASEPLFAQLRDGLRPAGVAVIPVSPPPQYVLAMAWRRDERTAAVHRFLDYIRSYRDRHAWMPRPELTRPNPGLVNDGRYRNQGSQ
jgi:DNA-binding transcriptional LysR family regulator